MTKYKLKEGVTLNPFGGTSEINNDNLTDNIAEYLIEAGRATLEDFEEVKEKEKSKKEHLILTYKIK